MAGGRTGHFGNSQPYECALHVTMVALLFYAPIRRGTFVPRVGDPGGTGGDESESGTRVGPSVARTTLLSPAQRGLRLRAAPDESPNARWRRRAASGPVLRDRSSVARGVRGRDVCARPRRYPSLSACVCVCLRATASVLQVCPPFRVRGRALTAQYRYVSRAAHGPAKVGTKHMSRAAEENHYYISRRSYEVQIPLIL